MTCSLSHSRTYDSAAFALISSLSPSLATVLGIFAVVVGAPSGSVENFREVTLGGETILLEETKWGGSFVLVVSVVRPTTM